jgi:hypothetical protein
MQSNICVQGLAEADGEELDLLGLGQIVIMARKGHEAVAVLVHHNGAAQQGERVVRQWGTEAGVGAQSVAKTEYRR